MGNIVQKIMPSDVKVAYLKLKHNVYYDANLLFMRDKLAEFESNSGFEQKILKIADFLNNYEETEQAFLENLLNEIDFKVLPKSFKEQEITTKGSILSNRFLSKSKKISKLSYFADIPIELHIISVIWILKIGYRIEENISDDNYGNRLEIEKNSKVVNSGLSLYKRYFDQYQKWRDKSIKKASQLLDEKKDVAIVGLDIKSFYHSCNIDFSKLKQEIGDDELDFLTDIIEKIHIKYSQLFNNGNAIILPIGFLTSGIIANWYLSDFDKNIITNLNPVSYSRYVDDVLIVIQNPKLDYDTKHTIEAFLLENFVKKDILEKVSDNSFGIVGYENLLISPDKITLSDFEGGGSKAVLDKFQNNILKSSSEFNFLPEESFNENLGEEAHDFNYSDSSNKLNSIRDLRIDKFSASKYIAKKIFKSTIPPISDNGNTSYEILNIFKGVLGIEFFTLWEKIFTFLVIHNEFDKIGLFYAEQIKSINSLELESDDELTIDEATLKQCKKHLKSFLTVSLSLASSLNPSFLRSRSIYNLIRPEIDDIILKIKHFRKSNLLRNTYLNSPAITFTDYCTKSHENNLIDPKFEKQNIDKKSIKYSPRYVPFSEIVNYKMLSNLFANGEKDQNETLKDLQDSSFNLFYKINYENRFLDDKEELFRVLYKTVGDDVQESSFKEDLRKKYYIKKKKSKSGVKYSNVVVPSSIKKQKLRVAIANHRIDSKNIEKSIKGNSVLTKDRKEALIKMLNEAKTLKADIIVLPENSVPYRWLTLLNSFVRKNNIGIILGLEHINSENTVYNFQAVLLPLRFSGISDVYMGLRLKNHYSPNEKFIIESFGFSVPKSNPYYELYNWSGVNFSTYNCYELADINHRSIFRSKVDFVVATEYNRDINYFSNIIESSSRDLHCFFIQVNSSDYGDSRVTQPSKTEFRDLIRLKGGENDAVLLTTLPINDLRQFQIKGYGLQKDDSRFKITPPDFDREEVKRRLDE
ncbi:hypothetical protein ABWH96_18770 [Marivirga tractuosa]|uniref:hypothetical protein n=1 Tax=Marivirga tractuosa TaxID=1006 RepID=UPI0035D1191F